MNIVANYAKRNRSTLNVSARKKNPLPEVNILPNVAKKVCIPRASYPTIVSLAISLSSFFHPVFRSAGVNKMLESAAFPNGLPNALEASVAVPLLSQGAASDDDHGRSFEIGIMTTLLTLCHY